VRLQRAERAHHELYARLELLRVATWPSLSLKCSLVQFWISSMIMPNTIVVAPTTRCR